MVESQNDIPDIEKDEMYTHDYRVVQLKSEVAFKTLMDGFNELLYKIPKYQRKYTWKKEQVINLAISLVRGLPIPPIYVYRNKNGQLEILDGQQRILSLFFYYKGKFIKNISTTIIDLKEVMQDQRIIDETEDFNTVFNEKYKLEDIDYEYEILDGNDEIIKINYAELDRKVKRIVDYRTISIVEIIVENSKRKERTLYKIFENLNSGGTTLSNQELRNGVYQSEFYDMLHRINKLKKWRNIYGEVYLYSRDIELLLRFTAGDYYSKLNNENSEKKLTMDNFKGSYPSFLNDFSDKAIKFSEIEISLYEKKIIQFIDRLDWTNESKKINLLLESLFIASQFVSGDYKITKELYNKIASDKIYQESTISGSSNRKKVNTRLSNVYRILSKYVEENNK